MKKVLKLLLFVFLMLGLGACQENGNSHLPGEKPKYMVVFDSKNEEPTFSVEVEKDNFVAEPTTPEYEGHSFLYWYLEDENTPFEFLTTPITGDITLSALWEPDEIVLTDRDKILLDIDIVEAELVVDPYTLKLPAIGENRSIIRWKTNSPYVSIAGKMVIPPRYNDEAETATLTATFTLRQEKIDYDFVIDLPKYEEVVLTESKVVSFTNLTTEYKVSDSEIELFFAENGSVPYVKVKDFFDLLEGFIDSEVEFEFDYSTEGITTISYDYYSESQDILFHLQCILDANENTITTEDPGFYQAYVKQTETNYGRHIKYDYNNENASYIDGEGLVLSLTEYNLNLISYEGEVLLPYSLANQLFAGSSYYNVYYNGDELYGVYFLPDEDDDEYDIIKTSSKNGTKMEIDMFLNTYNMLAFYFDHFYGLKEDADIETYYSVIDKYADDLLTLEANKFDAGVFKLINLGLDELHSSFALSSYYNRLSFKPPKITYVDDFGRNVKAWYNENVFPMQSSIKAKFGNFDNQPNYWFLDDYNLVITLDGFRTLDIEETASYDSEIVLKILEAEVIPEILSGNKFFFINSGTNDNKILNVLIKNTAANYIEDYIEALLLDDFVRVDPLDNYFEKQVDEKTYTLYVMYFEETELLTISVVDQSYELESEEDTKLLKTGQYDLVKQDSAVYLEIVFEQALKEKPTIENVVLDISYNTGGNIGALYRVVGFITDEPFSTTSINPGTKSASTSFVMVDGVPKYNHLNWALLASGVSFSAANSLVTIFKENNLGPIIGTKSGGGAASITPILLPNGSAFIMSSNSLGGYRTGEGTEDNPYEYFNNESGIQPDYILSIEKIFNTNLLLDILEEAFNDIENGVEVYTGLENFLNSVSNFN